MSLKASSEKLKELVSAYDTRWFLGDLSGLMKAIADGRANDQLGQLSSPLRQLYFLGGLLVSSDATNANESHYDPEKWDEIVNLLNEIEAEYDLLFFPKEDEKVDEEWKHIRKVAMPSFLSYFNQGPLNYEEQIINWVRDLYSQLDDIIENDTGLKTENFIQFYNNVDALVQKNFNSVGFPKGPVRPDWRDFTKIELVNTFPAGLGFDISEKQIAMFHFMSDHGMIKRFYPKEIVSDTLNIDQVNNILNLLSCKREPFDFLYYTATKPGNPLYEQPIINLEDGLYQVFEIKQIIHAIENLLEAVCSKSKENITKLIDKKGKLLEGRIVKLFSKFLKNDFKIFQGYFVDGCEQDILILWKDYAFIIEAKGYNLREPLRDPAKAFIRIKDDFKSCIGYGYTQALRVEKKFIEKVPLKICDNKGALIEEIDTTKYEDNAFSIIVNLKSFGQIQTDLSTLLQIDEKSSYPWAVKLDDLEVFLLTLIKQKKTPSFFVDFLMLREEMHDKLICSDELDICGGYLTGDIKLKYVEEAEMILPSSDFTKVFDKQYRSGMGFQNEKLLAEKESGNYVFW